MVVLSRGGNALIQFLIVLYYGANLTASEFGELSILMILIGLSYGLIDFGTANSIITRRINKATCGTLQLLNFSIATFIGLLLFVLAELRFGFFGFSEEFYQALMLTMPVFVIYACTIVPYARLHKALRLRQLALVDFLPVLSMLFTVPLFLHLGFGLSTLMMSVCVQVSFRFLVLRIYYGKMLRFRLKNTLPKKALARQYSSNFVIYLTSKLDQIMVAAFLSAESLGIYSFLKQVLNYPISLLIAIYTQITFPYFARFKNMTPKIRELLYSAIGVLLAVVIAYFLFLAALPVDFMLTLVPLWDFRGELAMVIMALSLSRLLLEALSAMAIAVGFVGRQLYINLTYLLITLLCGLALSIIGLNLYLISLSISATLISLYVYTSTFKRLNNGENRDFHTV